MPRKPREARGPVHARCEIQGEKVPIDGDHVLDEVLVGLVDIQEIFEVGVVLELDDEAVGHVFLGTRRVPISTLG